MGGSDVMRAAVLTAVERIEVRDVPCPPLRADEVRVRVQAVGLCGTDLHIFGGHANYNRDAAGRARPLAEHPQILGHEITGVIDGVGARVDMLRSGDRVVVDQGRSCVSEGRTPLCEYCATGHSHQCEHYREHGITGLPGGLAEYVSVPAVNAVRIESDLDAACAALTEPLGCVIHSVDVLMRTRARYSIAAGDDQTRTVLVCGAGPAGLLFLQYLRRVIGFDGLLLVSEPNARKRALVERYGGVAVNPDDGDVVELVRERTAGRGVEILIEATGAGAVFAASPGLARKQATILLYGHGHGGTDLSVMNAVQFLEPTLLSPAGASGGHEPDGRPTTYLRALRYLESATIDVASLITHRYSSLEAVSHAFLHDFRAPDYVKGVVVA